MVFVVCIALLIEGVFIKDVSLKKEINIKRPKSENVPGFLLGSLGINETTYGVSASPYGTYCCCGLQIFEILLGFPLLPNGSLPECQLGAYKLRKFINWCDRIRKSMLAVATHADKVKDPKSSEAFKISAINGYRLV